MISCIKTFVLLVVFQEVFGNYTWKIDVAPRRQWGQNSGYCGEVSTITALLNYGGYMSQYDMRIATAKKKKKFKKKKN